MSSKAKTIQTILYRTTLVIITIINIWDGVLQKSLYIFVFGYCIIASHAKSQCYLNCILLFCRRLRLQRHFYDHTINSKWWNIILKEKQPFKYFYRWCFFFLLIPWMYIKSSVRDTQPEFMQLLWKAGFEPGEHTPFRTGSRLMGDH